MRKIVLFLLYVWAWEMSAQKLESNPIIRP